MTTAEDTSLRIVLTTLPAGEDATVLARTLIDERLAACVSVLPAMISLYRWRDAIESAAEQQLVIKTTSERLDALSARLHSLHPYDVPEYVVLQPASASAAYLAWAHDATR